MQCYIEFILKNNIIKDIKLYKIDLINIKIIKKVE